MIFILVVSISACGSNTNKSVAETRLNIETYYAGENQPTHPSVISFAQFKKNVAIRSLNFY